MLQNQQIFFVGDTKECNELAVSCHEHASGSQIKVQYENNSVEALKQIKTLLPDLVFLDFVNLQENLQVCRELKTSAQTRHIPIIILVNFSDKNAALEALSYGADELVVKPVSSEEIMLRIKIKLQRLEVSGMQKKFLICGNLRLNLENLEVGVEGDIVPMSVLEFNLLKFFILNRERVLSRDRILCEVWKNSVVTSRTVDTHIVLLRRKLKKFNHEISTIYNAGYILRNVEKSATL